MKRLAAAIGTLVLATQIAGCDGGTSSTGPATGPPVKNSENPGLPQEARDFEAQQEAKVLKGMEKAKQKQLQKNAH